MEEQPFRVKHAGASFCAVKVKHRAEEAKSNTQLTEVRIQQDFLCNVTYKTRAGGLIGLKEDTSHLTALNSIKRLRPLLALLERSNLLDCLFFSGIVQKKCMMI